MTQELLLTVRRALEDPAALARLAALACEFANWTQSDVESLLDECHTISKQFNERKSTGANSAVQTVQVVVEAITRWLALQTDAQSLWSPANLDYIKSIYLDTDDNNNLRNHLLAALAASPATAALQLWVQLLIQSPPQHRVGIRIAFGPLMKRGHCLPADLRTRLLLEATPHFQIAPAIYELFNYYLRVKEIDVHPAADRKAALSTLLGHLVSELEKIEEGNPPPDLDPKTIGQKVTDSTALIVALIDTLGLLEHKDAVGKINQALDLRHRRIQTEAAAALARMGEENGRKALVALAEEPAVRLRVLAYAEEIGIDKDISLEYRGEIAQAESQLAIWLSEPAQVGIAPTEVLLIDNREFYWPSYDHPIQCFLFNYRYGISDDAYANIGICGPLTHSFTADLTHLSHADMYAAFAGWQTMHEEIFLMSPDKASQLKPKLSEKLKNCLEGFAADGFSDSRLESFGSFFGRIVLLASAKKDAGGGTLIIEIDQQENPAKEFILKGNPKAPIDWNLAFSIWQGRQLLKTFNSPE